MIKRIKLLTLACFSALFSTGCSANSNEINFNTIELNISAAASLKEVMVDLESVYKSKHPEVSLVINYGSSGSLQQQIQQGAPCDLFISAGKKQMDTLNNEGLLLSNTNKDLVTNSLVLVASSNSTLDSIKDLNTDMVFKIAIGEPFSVPAGKYADETLIFLSIKDSLNEKLVFAKNVKEVLTWTASSNADAGFVYLTDALNNENVKIVQAIPADYHSPITYPVAVINDSDNIDTAKTFEDFLFTSEAQEIFEKYGYKSIK